jgi:hypothetical protein
MEISLVYRKRIETKLHVASTYSIMRQNFKKTTDEEF